MSFLALFLSLVLFLTGPVAAWGESGPPPPEREFRGLWVATVNNIDWPSRPGLTTAQQKQELLAIIERASALRFNAVIFQVRSGCDALYHSELEPWSEYLTGRMGQAPSPYYDPLEFAVSEAHKRGLELHAWFNPYRAGSRDEPRSAVSPRHVTVRHPELVRPYGKYLWLDPAEPATREHSLNVILDVVRRYDIDAVHFDDYFYPYPDKADNRPNAPDMEFPDGNAWRRYQAHGGRLSRADWRRQNVDEFISAVSAGIKKINPRVQFGVSPFGIWRPGHPAQISGFDSFEKLYCDSRKWLAEGWLDYCAPQLYWPVDQKAQSFPVLLRWWSEQNSHHRNLYAGMRLTGWPGVRNDVAEEEREIEDARRQPGAAGEILWHSKPLLRDENGVADALGRKIYSAPALTPERPWIAAVTPWRPQLQGRAGERELKLNWSSTNAPVWLWVVQKRVEGHWTTEILPGEKTSETLFAGAATPLPTEVAVTAVNNYGKAGEAAVFRRGVESAAK